MPPEPPEFDQWYAASAGTDANGRRFALRQDRGWLSLPSGRVVAAEPGYFVDADRMGFTQTVPPGRYPVELLIEDCPVVAGPGAGTGATIAYVAAARIVVRDEPAASWEMAVLDGEDPAHLDDDEFFGYPVDGGLGCFTDVQALRTLDMADDDPMEAVLIEIAEGIAEGKASLSTLTDGGENGEPILVAFGTGCGDGYYPTWVGRNARGDITCFVTDFLLADAEPAV